ncbi:MAG: PAS domain S-box protein, partial [Chloroflexota bacterium]|nr:PAS domain S-box protein [Chloroflexota bacterium]
MTGMDVHRRDGTTNEYPMADRLFEMSSDGIFVDRDGIIVAVNPAGVELYGCSSAADLIGVATVDLVPPSQRDFIRRRAVRAGTGQEVDHVAVEEILRPDGTRRTVEVRTGPIEWEGGPAVLAILRDVTAEHSAADALEARVRASRLYGTVSLRLATASEETLDDAITDTLRAIGSAEGVGRAYAIVFTDDDRIRCTHEWCAPGVDPQIGYVQDLPMSAFPWSVATLLDNRVVHVVDLDALPPEAEPEQASFGLYGVKSVLQVPMIVGDSVIGLIGFNALGHRLEWAEETIAFVRSVADAVATALIRRASQREARTARDQAQAANDAKDLFLSRMSHELRTPLNAVLGFTELLLLDDRSDRDRVALERIRASGEHLLSLVEDVLDVSRIEAGRLSMTVEPLAVAPLVDDAIAIVTHAAAGREVTIDVRDHDLAGMVVRGD